MAPGAAQRHKSDVREREQAECFLSQRRIVPLHKRTADLSQRRMGDLEVQKELTVNNRERAGCCTSTGDDGLHPLESWLYRRSNKTGRREQTENRAEQKHRA